nr:MAG TPA: hypothetical protein [Caudoviricetes sp.]
MQFQRKVAIWRKSCTIAITAPKTLQFQRKVAILYHFTTFFSING